MKILKSVLCVVLALLMVFSLTACHKKNEVAVTVNGVEFTSAMYSYALLNADSEARSLVDEKHAEDTDHEHSADEVIDYYAQEIDGKKYVKWVEDRAIEMIRDWAAIELLCKENKISLDEAMLSQAKSYSEYYYSYYGQIFEANGIGEETYAKIMQYEYLSDMYFDFLYGKEGSKAVAENDVKKSFKDSYRVVFMLQKDITSLKDDELAKAKTEMEDYKKKVEKGEKLTDLYNKFNNLTKENSATTGQAPVEKITDCANVIADPEVDANYGADFFKDIKDMSVGAVKVIEHTQGTSKSLILVSIIDSESDKSYLENMDRSIRWNLKNEEYLKELSAYAATLKVEKNKYAINAFKVKDIYLGN